MGRVVFFVLALVLAIHGCNRFIAPENYIYYGFPSD
jgi:hypothetical protein